MSADGSRGYAKDSGRGLVVHVQQQPQRDDLALTSGQPPQRGQQVAADHLCLLHRHRSVVVIKGDLTPTAAPPGHMRIQRDADHPCPRHLQRAHLPPRHPCPGVRLCHEVLGQVQVTDIEQHDPQAVLAGGIIELREFRQLLLHTSYTHHRADPFSRPATAATRRRPPTKLLRPEKPGRWVTADGVRGRMASTSRLEVIEATVFRTISGPVSPWELLLPAELLRLPEELAQVDVLLDDPAFFAPFAPYFHPVLGRPSTPVECYLRLMFLKFRYRLGYESLCAEGSDSISRT